MRVLVVLALLTGVVFAEDRKAAERYFRAGAKAYAAQNFAAAATNFDEAYKALPMPEIAFSGAQAYRKLYQVEPRPHHVRRAVELYEAYLAAVKTGGRVGDAADNLADMKRELAKLEASGVATTAAPAELKRTRLGINATVVGAAGESGALGEIGDATGDSLKVAASIDGKTVEPFALVEVEPNKEHVLAASADGFFPAEKRVRAVDGESQFIDIELRPRPAKVVVKTESAARISVDGRYAATAPTTALELTAGKHLVTILRNGREPFAQEVTVARGQELTMVAPLRKTGRREAVPWVLGGAGVLLAGAVTTGLVANARDNRAIELRDGIEMGNRPASDADALDRAVSSRDRFVTWTWILGSAAVVTGGVGGFLFFFDRPTADSGTVGITGTF